MKIIVVFFSFEGNTRMIAHTIAERLDADVCELKTAKEYPAGGIGKYFWGGKSVLFGEKPELTNETIDFDSYDVLILGTPIWAGSYAPPIHTFIHQYKIENKQLAFFACHAGGGAKKCFEKLKEALPRNTFLGQMEFQEPLKGNREDHANKAVQWAASLGV